MTAQQLAQRCAELGAPIHRTTITKIENGRPRFDLGELIVLAAALSTTPVTLLYPGPYENEVEVLPGREAPEFQAAQWFSGIEWHSFASIGDSREGSAGWLAATERLGLWRQLAEQKMLRNKAVVRMISDERTDDVASRELIAMHDRVIDDLEAQLGIGNPTSSDVYEYRDGQLRRLDDDDPRRQPAGDPDA
ncbi:putative DNA-binding protein [Mycolicibacterium insubricum]|nr:putative DNA-binding protein [Mycolicibacterium insubricum]